MVNGLGLSIGLIPILNHIPIPSIATDSKDKYMWCTKDGKVVNYNTKIVWNDLYREVIMLLGMIWFSFLIALPNTPLLFGLLFLGDGLHKID